MEEEDVLKNAQYKVYMLHYVLMGSEEYHQCYQEDISLCPSPKGSSVSSSNLAIADKIIGETGKSKDKMGKGTTALNSTAADETQSRSTTMLLETGKEASTKAQPLTVVQEMKEPSTKDSVSDKLSEGTKSQPTTVVLETVKELSTEGVTDQIFSTTQVLSQGTKSHPTTEYHPPRWV